MRRLMFIVGLMALILVIAAGVAFAVTKIGDNQANTINGTSDSDNLYGIGAADTIDGRAANDFIEGGTGDDRLLGDGGEDNMSGGPGGDDIGGGGASDYILSGTGPDEVSGGDANDYIVVTDNVGGNDDVNCGPGDADALVPDPGDTWVNCELVDAVG